MIASDHITLEDVSLTLRIHIPPLSYSPLLMQSPAERHKHILECLKEQGYVTVSDLSDQLDVSEVTIRRDLRLLEDRNLLYRTHGGANPTNHLVYDRPVQEKAKQHMVEKQRIGQAAAGLVDDNDFLIFASGTTVHAVSRNLRNKRNVTVVTSAMNVAMELLSLPEVEIIMLGGVVRHTSTSVVGPHAEIMMVEHACRKLFLGVDGFDIAHGLTTTNPYEAHLNQIMIAAAQQAIVVTDSSKFGLRGFSRICGVDKIDKLITDSGAPEAMLRQIEEAGVGVTVV